MLYVDTSVIVSALTKEAERLPSLRSWLARQETSELTISDWTTTEFASALSIKLRTGALGADHRAAALSAFTRLCVESLSDPRRWSGKTFARPRGLRDQSELNLRCRRRPSSGDLRQPWSVALHARSTPRGSCATSWRPGARSYAARMSSAILTPIVLRIATKPPRPAQARRRCADRPRSARSYD